MVNITSATTAIIIAITNYYYNNVFIPVLQQWYNGFFQGENISQVNVRQKRFINLQY